MPTIEERLEKVERELERMKGSHTSGGSGRKWITAITGSFKDDPAFDEILRLGKEIRDAERPEDA